MKRFPRFFAWSLAALALGGAGCAGTFGSIPYEQGAERYEFKFTLTKAPAETGTCTASATVRDRRTGRKIVVPIFTAPWGRESTSSAVDAAYDARLEVRVMTNETGDRGVFTASLRRGDQLIASQEATVPVRIVRPNLTPG